MIATALRIQHADIHKSESRSKHKEDRPRAYLTFTSSNSSHTSERIQTTTRSRQLWIWRRRRTRTLTITEETASPTPSRSSKKTNSNLWKTRSNRTRSVLSFLRVGTLRTIAGECSSCVHDEFFSFHTRHHAKDGCTSGYSYSRVPPFVRDADRRTTAGGTASKR